MYLYYSSHDPSTQGPHHCMLAVMSAQHQQRLGPLTHCDWSGKRGLLLGDHALTKPQKASRGLIRLASQFWPRGVREPPLVNSLEIFEAGGNGLPRKPT
jgi:hypothetical protein